MLQLVREIRQYFIEFSPKMFPQIGEVYGLMATRILIGLFQGPLLPGISVFGVVWFPIQERGRTVALVLSGLPV